MRPTKSFWPMPKTASVSSLLPDIRTQRHLGMNAWRFWQAVNTSRFFNHRQRAHLETGQSKFSRVEGTDFHFTFDSLKKRAQLPASGAGEAGHVRSSTWFRYDLCRVDFFFSHKRDISCFRYRGSRTGQFLTYPDL